MLRDFGCLIKGLLIANTQLAGGLNLAPWEVRFVDGRLLCKWRKSGWIKMWASNGLCQRQMTNLETRWVVDCARKNREDLTKNMEAA